ncbi:MAG: hypothetical protein D6731_17555 [Planctomycetota bacterium]|nr:MAG: hypothetical protein D6731_17555 [Planctomycetota bacterium]
MKKVLALCGAAALALSALGVLLWPDGPARQGPANEGAAARRLAGPRPGAAFPSAPSRPLDPVRAGRGAAGEGSATAPTEPASVPDASRGWVLGPEGAPLAAAQVWLAGEDGAPRLLVARSDAKGSFPWPPGEAPLVLVARGHAPRVVPPDGPRRVRLRRSVRLEGSVVAAGRGDAIEGASVEAIAADYAERARTDAQGRFVLHPPDGVAVDLFVRAEGFVGSRFGADALPTLELARGRALRGRLVLPGGEAAAGAAAWAVDAQDPARARRLVLDPDGRFRAQGFAGPEVWVLAVAKGAATPLRPRWRTLPGQGGEGGLAVPLEGLGSLRAPGPAGAAAPQLEPAYLPCGVDLSLPAPAREGAAWRWLDLPPGPYLLSLPGDPSPHRVEVRPGKVTEWAAGAGGGGEDAPREVRVRVVDGQGLALEGARVVADGASGRTQGLADARGEVVLRAPAGDLTLTATAPGRALPAPRFWPAHAAGEASLVLLEVSALEGRVFPPEEGTVRLLSPDGERVLRRERVDAVGRFRFADVPEGDYVLEADSEHRVPVRVPVHVPWPVPVHLHLDETYGECRHEH